MLKPRHLLKRGKKAYPNKETNVNGALGYNTYLLILDAIKRAGGTDSAALTKAWQKQEFAYRFGQLEASMPLMMPKCPWALLSIRMASVPMWVKFT